MTLMTRLLPSVLLGALGAAVCTDAVSKDNGNFTGLSGRVFLVEATIVSSPPFPEYEGFSFPSCFIFEEDGTWIDLEFPGEGAEPIPGVWIQHTEVPHVNFTATAVDPSIGWSLIEYGVANPGRGLGNQSIETYGMVFGAAQELIFYVRSEGRAVDACPLL